MAHHRRINALMCTALAACAVLAGEIVGANLAAGDPLTPAEIAFLADMKQWRAGQTDPQLFQDDAGLLQYGWRACQETANGVNPARVGISPVITTYAYHNLCPQFH